MNNKVVLILANYSEVRTYTFWDRSPAIPPPTLGQDVGLTMSGKIHVTSPRQRCWLRPFFVFSVNFVYNALPTRSPPRSHICVRRDWRVCILHYGNYLPLSLALFSFCLLSVLFSSHSCSSFLILLEIPSSIFTSVPLATLFTVHSVLYKWSIYRKSIKFLYSCHT